MGLKVVRILHGGGDAPHIVELSLTYFGGNAGDSSWLIKKELLAYEQLMSLSIFLSSSLLLHHNFVACLRRCLCMHIEIHPVQMG